MLVDREIKMMDEILWQYQQQDEQISARRQFLFALVALPLTLQSRSHDLRADRDIEEFLRLCSVSLSTCWHLMRGQGIAVLEEVVAQYVPTLMSLVRRPSPSQPLAARLATQAKFLQALLCMHRLDFAGRELHCLEAVQYSRLSGSGKMQVAALQYLGYFYVYYLAGRSEKAIAIFLEALRLLGTEDSLFRSNIYIGLADAYAQRGEEKQALESIELAKQHCPNDPEQDPSFLYAACGWSELYRREGRTYLDLARHSPDRDFYQRAYAASTRSVSLQSSIGERGTTETLIHLADAACGLGELELYVDCLHKGAQMAIALGSHKRYSEAVEVFQRTPDKWKAEQRILVLAKDVFR